MTEWHNCHEVGIGELFVAGDVACEQGDLKELTAVAEHLIVHVPEPLHCELVPLARACSNARCAATAWKRLKERLEPPRA